MCTRISSRSSIVSSRLLDIRVKPTPRDLVSCQVLVHIAIPCSERLFIHGDWEWDVGRTPGRYMTATSGMVRA